MMIGGTRSMIFLLISLVVAAAAIALQIYLSRRPARFPGLILPILSFAISLIVAFGILSFRLDPAAGNSAMVVEPRPSWEMILLTFALYNLPTVVLLLIYAACRWKKAAVRSQMDKMRIDDLG